MNVAVFPSSTPPFLQAYLVVWILACIVAVVLMVRYRHQLTLLSQTYRKQLFQKWKIVTFLLAITGVTVIAPYTGDPTWDYVDAIFMSVLTFYTAPWSVGVLFRFVRYKKSWLDLYIAVSVWMFSASWSYDGYLIIRDGMYPMTWFSNIFASSVLYCSAGLLWSLEWRHLTALQTGYTYKRDLKIRAHVLKRSNGRCEYCGKKIADDYDNIVSTCILNILTDYSTLLLEHFCIDCSS